MIVAAFVGLIIRALISSLIGAVILRAAIALFNKMAGPVTKTGGPVSAADPDQWGTADRVTGVDSGSPYQAPMTTSAPIKTQGTAAIEPPDFGRAYLIILVATIINSVFGFVIGLLLPMAFDGEGTTGLSIIALIGVVVISYAVLMLTIQLMLPTTPIRALAVTGLFFAITLAVVLVIAAIAMVTIGGLSIAG